jgi:hypothetical protein
VVEAVGQHETLIEEPLRLRRRTDVAAVRTHSLEQLRGLILGGEGCPGGETEAEQGGADAHGGPSFRRLARAVYRSHLRCE